MSSVTKQFVDRLKSDLEVLRRYETIGHSLTSAREGLETDIAKLEAAADPWREAKGLLIRYRGSLFDTGKMVAYSDHLSAEVARLTERVGELEAGIKAEDDSDVLDAEYTLKHGGFVPFEGPIVGLEPVLDPARVLATARHTLKDSDDSMHGSISYLLWCHVKESQDAKPYPLKKGGE